jgi:GNAT superfamily N-acetyltransferase
MEQFSEPTFVSSAEDIAEICRFRAAVWAATGTLEPNAFGQDGWRDPVDDDAFHWAIRHSSGRLAAAGRLTFHSQLSLVHQADEYLRYGLDFSGPIAAPDRVVVAPEFQGHGLGAILVDLQDRVARAFGAQFAVRQASDSMARIIARRGWRLVGPASADPRFPGASFTVAYRQIA